MLFLSTGKWSLLESKMSKCYRQDSTVYLKSHCGTGSYSIRVLVMSQLYLVM